jgi:hypothetical protein
MNHRLFPGNSLGRLPPELVCIAAGLAAFGPAVVAAVRQSGGDRGQTGHISDMLNPVLVTRRRSRALFDDSVGAAEQRERKRDAEQLGGLQVEYKLDSRRLLHRQGRRLFALQNAPGIDADDATCLALVRALSL